MTSLPLSFIKAIGLSILQRYFHMIEEQRSKLLGPNQQDLPIKFQVGYQYASDRLAPSIFKHVTDDFILPAYVQRYYQKAQKRDQQKNQHVPRYKIIDCKILKNINGKELDFLSHDKGQFVRIQKISEKNQKKLKDELKHIQLKAGKQQQNVIDINAKKKQNSTAQEKEKQQKFLKNEKEAITNTLYIFQKEKLFTQSWENGLKRLKNLLKYSQQNRFKDQIKSRNYIKAILFCRSENNETNNYKDFFILIRCQQQIKKIKNKSPLGDKIVHMPEQDMEIQESRQEKDFIIQFDGASDKVRQVLINFHGRSVQISKQGFTKVDQNNLRDPKIKLIDFEIKGMNQFIGIAPREENVFMECEPLDYKHVKNQIGYFFRGFQFQKDKRFGQKHYDLAFQGGGAKGLAYVGAYKALKQNKIDEKQIEIGSIMGSSAGGITAIAASTGISHRQIQQLCYKMDDIPKEDKITSGDQAFDQYGNKITFAGVESKLRELFTSFGILNEQTFDQIAKIFKEKIYDIGQEIINYLKIAAPSIADIFNSEKKVQKTEGWLFWKKNVLKHQINWDGVFLHGALMKGESLYKIAAECLVKYLLKISYSPQFKQKLLDAFSNWQQDQQKEHKIDVNNFQRLLFQYKQLHIQILNSSIQSLWGQSHNKKNKQIKQKYINESIICIVNKIMILMNQFLQDVGSKLNKSEMKIPEKLNISAMKISEKLNYSLLFQYKQSKIVGIITKIKQSIKDKLDSFNLNQQMDNLCRQLNYVKQFGNKKISTFQYVSKLIQQQKNILENITKLQKYLKEGIIDQCNESGTLAYYLKLMYFYRQIEDEIQKKTLEKQLYEIQLKLRGLNNIDRILSCKTYNQLNSQTNTVNLLNHKHFTQRQENMKDSIIKYVRQIFEGSYNKDIIAFSQQKIKGLINNIDHQNQNQKQIQIKTIKRRFIFQLCDQINNIQTQKQAGTYNTGVVYRKGQNFSDLIKEASKITMKEYYNLNPIQVTCTSVDLDNKILRFFNHKTTPNLPICRAVQMTGSFPFAFKALRWKQQWGYYYVHHENKKVAINIVGHEFTDGGLLANFPIKYFDNKIIRNCYFSHSLQKHNSIMVGFGLDALNEGSYQKATSEIQKENKQNIQKQIAFRQISEKFTAWFKLKEGIKIFFNSRWLTFGQKEEQWENFNVKLLEQIPILRFLTKVFSSYPNADRNLNLQAFSQEIMVQTTNDVSTINIRQMIIMNAKDSKDKYQIKKVQWIHKVKKCFVQFQLFKNITKNTKKKHTQNNQDSRWSQILERIKRLKQDEKNILRSAKNGFELFFHNILSKKFNGERMMSELLIKMFLITLKTNTANNQNKIIREILSNRYIYFSFISKKIEKYNHQQLKDTSLKSQIKGIKQEFNLKHMQKFFEINHFEELQNHGDFHQFKKQYLKQFGINDLDFNYKEKVSQIRQKYNSNFQKVEQQLTKIQQQNSLKRQKLWNTIESKLKNNSQINLFDFQLIDITFSYKRMIKYLYLQIKGSKIIDKQKIKQYISPLNNNLKAIIMQNYRKFSFLNKYEKQTFYNGLIDPTTQNYLTFNEIFDFLYYLKDHGICKNNKYYKIQYSWQFEQYLQNVNNVKPQLQKNQKKIFTFDLFVDNIEERSLQLMSSNLLSKDPQENTIVRYKLIEKLCQQKFNKIGETFLLSQQINSLGIQKMNEKNMKQHLKKILPEQSKQKVKQLTEFLSNSIHFEDNPPISVQNDIYIKNLRYEAKKCLKNIIFGQKLQNQRKVFDSIKSFKKQCCKDKKSELEIDDNQHQKDDSDIFFTYMDESLLQYFYYKMLNKYLENKFAKNQKRQQFCLIHKAYIKDIQYLFTFLRKMGLLVTDYQEKCQIIPSQNQAKKLFTKYKKIISQLYKNLEQLVLLPQNEITIQKLDQTFLIKYGYLFDISSLLRKIVRRKKILFKEHQLKLIQLKQNDLKLFHISQQIIEFNNYKFCLPLFTQDWQQLTKINQLTFFTKYRMLYLKDTNDQKYQQIISSVTENQTNKNLLQNKRKGEQSPDLHLIIEGAASSNQAFCAYFNQMNNSTYYKDGNLSYTATPNFKIKIVTSTTLIGFLMCLGQDINQIRKDMYTTRNYLFEMFDHQKIMNYYKQHGPIVSLNGYNTLAEHYKLQILNVMKIFEQQYQKQSGSISYLKKFNDIRLLVQQQQQYYAETCNQILDAAAQQIKQIETKFLNSQMANKIAKKFGFDYTCNFNKRHQYGKYNKQCKQIFNEIMVEYYEQFGSLISAITCNFINNKIPFTINLDNAQSFTKGFMIARLMTTYKLKAFIFNKLEQYGFPYDITLHQFYERCRDQNKIIINFVVVNMTQKRIDFLNKITTPNMPVWAAILAASSLPSLHRCFQSQKQWDYLSGQKFKTNQMLSFFKESQILKRKYTLYSSAILISSIPMQLLTNNTFINKYKELNSNLKIQHNSTLRNIGFAFNPTYSTNLFHMKIEKKYFNLSFGILRIAKKLMFDCQQLIITSNQEKHKQQHYNRSYEVNHYNPINQLKLLLFQNNVTVRILQTLVQSNDNLVMKWYSDKLIRLPIKIGTLSFNQAVDQNVFDIYRLKIPSLKAKDALTRSYQITKTFIYDIQNRFKYNKLQYNQKRSTSKPQRFLANLRVEFIQKTNPFSGFSQQFIKVVFLNHSKWNQNMYNNFVIQYQAQDTSDYKRCENSQILWLNEEGAFLNVRFYYLHYLFKKQHDEMFSTEDYFTRKNSEIMFTELIFDFNPIIKQSHTNSYDYQFVYGWNQSQQKQKKRQEQKEKETKQKQKQKQKQELKPKFLQLIKLNGISVDAEQANLLPKVEVIQRQRKDPKLIENKYCEEYIDQSRYRVV